MRLLVSFLLCMSSVFAAGSVSQSFSRLGSSETWVLIFEWLGDAGDGSVPATAARLSGGGAPDFQGYVLQGVEFSPGTPAPAAGYSVAIRNGVGVDMLEGGGASLSATTASSSAPGTNSLPLNGTFTLNITGSSVASARGRVFVYFQKPSSVGMIRISSSGGGGGTASGIIPTVSVTAASYTMLYANKGSWHNFHGGAPSTFTLPAATSTFADYTATILNASNSFDVTINVGSGKSICIPDTSPATCYTSFVLHSTYELQFTADLGSAGDYIGLLRIGVPGSGGSSAFSSLTSSTNTAAAMVVGTGASLSVTGAGTIAATTAAALAANPTDCASNQFAISIVASGNLTCAAPFTLTTTGSSGAATFTGGTLNIPQYSGSGGSPGGSAITDAQCWASSTTFGVCANINLSGVVRTGGATDGCAGGTAGCDGYGQGTAPSGAMTTGIQEYAPTSVTSYNRVKPGTVGTAGFVRIAVASTTATESFGPLVASDIPAVALTTGTSITLSNSSRFFECTNTCTITVPVPAAGVQYCVRNANNVATVITFAAIGSSAMYENTASTAYGTAGTGTLISGGTVLDKMCIVGKDSTHYDVFSFAGSWTAS